MLVPLGDVERVEETIAAPVPDLVVGRGGVGDGDDQVGGGGDLAGGGPPGAGLLFSSLGSALLQSSTPQGMVFLVLELRNY